MISSTLINYNKSKHIEENTINEIYFLPSWEIIKRFTITESFFYFIKKTIDVELLHKLSTKNRLEKYSVRTVSGEILAYMNIIIYKDSVFIVDLALNTKKKITGALEMLIRAATDKAIKETTNKEVYINILPEQKNRRKIKKILINSGFSAEENQSRYEMNTIGEMYKLVVNNDTDSEAIQKSKLIIK